MAFTGNVVNRRVLMISIISDSENGAKPTKFKQDMINIGVHDTAFDTVTTNINKDT